MKTRIILSLLISLASVPESRAMQLSHEDKQASIRYREQLVREAKELGISTNRNNADLKAAIREGKKRISVVNRSISTPPAKEHVLDGPAHANYGDELSRRNNRERSLTGESSRGKSIGKLLVEASIDSSPDQSNSEEETFFAEPADLASALLNGNREITRRRRFSGESTRGKSIGKLVVEASIDSVPDQSNSEDETFFASSAHTNDNDESRKKYREKLVREAHELGISTDKNNADLKAAIRAERDRITSMSKPLPSLRTEENLTESRRNYREELVRDAEYLGISTNQNNKDLKAAIKEAKKHQAIEREYEMLKHCGSLSKSPIKLFFGELPEISDREKREQLERDAKSLGIFPSGTDEEIKYAIKLAIKNRDKARLEDEAVSIGLAPYGTAKELQKRIQDRKAALRREKIEEEAYSLGLSTLGSSEELQKAIQEKKVLIHKQKEADRLEKEKAEAPLKKLERDRQMNQMRRPPIASGGVCKEIEERQKAYKMEQAAIQASHVYRTQKKEQKRAEQWKKDSLEAEAFRKSYPYLFK